MTLNNVCSISGGGKKRAGDKSNWTESRRHIGTASMWLAVLEEFDRSESSLALSPPPPPRHCLHFISGAARKCLVKCEMPTFRWPLLPYGATFGICHAPYFLCCGPKLDWNSAGDSSSSATNFMGHSFPLPSPSISNIAEALVSKGLATVIRYRQDDDQRSSHYDELLAAEARWGLAHTLFRRDWGCSLFFLICFL